MMISVYNRNNSEIRPLDEDKVSDNMFVAWNGSAIGEACDTLKKALDLHFGENRHGIHCKTNFLFATAGATKESVLKREMKIQCRQKSFCLVFHNTIISAVQCRFLWTVKCSAITFAGR